MYMGMQPMAPNLFSLGQCTCSNCSGYHYFIDGSILLYCFRCQRLFLAKSTPHTALDGLQPDGPQGVGPMTAQSKGQADGM